jgi:hypothetical protein
MELANLVLKLEFLCNILVAGQIVGDNDRDAMLLDKRRQPARHRLRILFIDVAYRQRFSCAQIHDHQN